MKCQDCLNWFIQAEDELLLLFINQNDCRETGATELQLIHSQFLQSVNFAKKRQILGSLIPFQQLLWWHMKCGNWLQIAHLANCHRGRRCHCSPEFPSTLNLSWHVHTHMRTQLMRTHTTPKLAQEQNIPAIWSVFANCRLISDNNKKFSLQPSSNINGEYHGRMKMYISSEGEMFLRSWSAKDLSTSKSQNVTMASSVYSTSHECDKTSS